ncbi:MAG: Ig-like domain-containing protein [Stellaceae bacterium]
MRYRLLVGLAGAILLAGVTAVLILPRGGTAPGSNGTPRTALSRAVPEPANEPAGQRAEPQLPAPVPPSFDIVKVGPTGTAVIAGRAEPGSKVTVRDGDKLIGEVTADSRGEWVLVPEQPMGPGDRLLSLEASNPQSGMAVKSHETVALSIGPAAPGGQAGTALAVLLPRDGNGGAKVLQRPDAAAAQQALSLESVEYDGQDRVVLTGRSAPGATVQIYAADRPLATATADASGVWSAITARPAGRGDLELRLDQLAEGGRVAQRITVPLAQASAVQLAPGQLYTVQPGNNLWQISRRAYGAGNRYLIIYSANLAQIRDPERIYPGQIFRLPKS